MLSVARPLAPRQGFTAAFIASPTTSFRSFATTTTTTTNDTATSDTSPTSPGQHGSITRDPPTAPAPVGIAPLPHRRIICVAGEMTTAFLNGLTTNKIPSWIKQIEEGFRGLYTGILNAQGRVMFDAFIYPTTVVNKDGEPVRACYVEFDEALGTQPMFLLKRYRLRAKVTLEYARDRGVFCAWGPGFGEDKRGGTRPHLPKPGELITMPDARIPGFGTRFEIEALQSLPRVSTDHYHIRRFLTGLPEGPREVVLGDSLPLECNMDLMRGIDFQKGCYVGQELTIRTKHTGVVRKRVLPVRLYNLDAGTAPSTLELEVAKEVAKELRAHRRQNRAVGRFLNGIGNVGLALCRLDAMTDV
ncbi:transcription factor, component of CCR4 transcriptional complex, partial [Phyllosticta citrichinensis]